MKSLQRYFANTAYLPTGWAKNVIITVDSAGWISDIQIDQTDSSAINLQGPIIPGMANVHSHAFQRAMAGLAERSTGDKDSFWTWREVMYRFLERITPEDQEAIAAQLYVEMLKAGYTTVGEFHYLHNQVDGQPYADRALTSQHLIAAAKATGIAMTHMPVLYAYSNFGAKKPTEGQKRFINDGEQIVEIVATLMREYRDDPQVTIGFAHHSLRAVSTEMLVAVTRAVRDLNPTLPIHMHLSEQMKEVNDCLAWCGKRPLELLLEHVELTAQWCLIHATHLNADELRALAASGAVAGLCPSTEANLGDGLFNLPNFLLQQGRFGIGTDSQISMSVREELRLLEYGQRLLRQERSVIKTTDQPSIGTTLYRAALRGGAQAMGRATGQLAVGQRADFLALDMSVPTMVCKEEDYIFDAMIFAGNVNPIRHVIVGGKQVVRDYRHVAEENVLVNYRKTLEKIIL